MEEDNFTWQVRYGKKDIKRVDVSKIVDFSGVSEASEDGEVKVAFTNPFDVPDYKPGKKKEDMSVAEKDMEALIKGIEEFGVMVPLIVREKDGKYELLSGYRRKKAVEFINEHRAKKDRIDVPIIVVPNCDDARAKIILTASNTYRRKISLKEQIKACGEAYRTMRKARPDASKEEIAKKVVELFDVLPDNVIRYSMLVNLNDGLLELIGGENEKGTRKRTKSEDKKPGKIRLSRRAGVSLATLNESQQEILLNVLEANKDIAISVELASDIRRKFAEKDKGKGKDNGTNMTEEELKELILGKQGEQSTDNQSKSKSINWNDLLSDIDNKQSKKIFGVLKNFLKKWQEAGSPENFEITSTVQTQQAVESSPEV